MFAFLIICSYFWIRGTLENLIYFRIAFVLHVLIKILIYFQQAVASQTSKDEQIIEQERLGGHEIGGSSEVAGCENCGSKGAGGKSSKTGGMKKPISDVELECVPSDGGMEKSNPGDKYVTLTESLLRSMNVRKEKDLTNSERYKATLQ